MNTTDIIANKSPIEMLYHWEKTTPNKVFLRQPKEGVWHEYSWQEVGRQARCLVSALHGLGLKKGDRIAIISKNCAEWIITDLALQLGGFISVPLYFDQTPDSFKYILEHSESKALFAGKLDHQIWQRLHDHIPDNMIKIGFSFHGRDADTDKSAEMDYCITDLINDNQPWSENPIPKDDDQWTFIYTSGTTGHPKGVVHGYGAPRHIGPRSVKEFSLTQNERFFSYLPLAHVAERSMLNTTAIYCGGEVSFTQSLATFQQDLRSVEPTLFFSVPRLWKKFQSGILANIPQKKLSTLLKTPIVKHFIAKKIQKKLGFAHTRMFFSGAAPISTHLLNWYAELGIEIQEGYGMTENFAYGVVARQNQTKFGSVGQALPDSGFQLGDNNEILFKSPTLMQCYYKDEKNTAEAMTADGFYKTGDKGEVDDQGFVKITGRIKESFKTEKGEYVVPEPIENKLSSLHDLEQVCITGRGLAQPIAIVTLSDTAQTKPKPEINIAIEAHITELNQTLLNHEKIGGVVVSGFEWTPDTGLITPTLKIKRNKVEEHYQTLMLQALRSKTIVAWEAA